MKENSFLCKPNVTLEIENCKDSLQNEIMKQIKKRSRQQEGEIWVSW